MLKLPPEEEDHNKEGGSVPIINTTFSFSDVLSPQKEEKATKGEKIIATAVTDSGPLRMRLKGVTDFSTHHFESWKSPGQGLSQDASLDHLAALAAVAEDDREAESGGDQ